MSQTLQGELFPDLEPQPSAVITETGELFADIVFDRPLDHAYTYAVPGRLAGEIAVGKRVLAPFGKGDRATVGYCVRVQESPPTRETKALLRILDEEPLLTPDLLRLTRWI